ncbi:hypothetical protein B2G71_02495 [Novosphingobium sp. PC22D]|uniref:pentapeptide repeat-containing protein n=1 Tax=Novosphingobium sp. PC22D TaxID=1962403 RepID=UPI000BEF9DA3|nr:pentapeptide repeat-containing protein [Novosphingobium sp. PC22D]PEQ14474.1 hypothetical protein B2G71_02495 [Novosphingobium sp. PC22D]
MVGRFGNWLWNDFFGPQNERRFRFRINRRVNWLYFRQGWRHKQWRKAVLPHLVRPIAVLLVGAALPILTLLALDLFSGGERGAAHQIWQFLTQTTAEPTWRSIGQPLLILTGVPAAYVLWLFRDINARRTLENQRKDVNLKEFQEIQLRAAGAMDKDKLAGEAREQLQIAALHQLRGYLKGEYGEAFRRPALELLLAGHAAAMERAGLKEAVERWRKANPDLDPVKLRGYGGLTREAIASARQEWTPPDRERAGILRDEARHVFCRDFPLNGRRFDGVVVAAGNKNASFALLARLQLSGSALTGADLSWARLEGADLIGARLEGADLSWAHLEGADLFGARLESADLSWAHLEGADLSEARLEGADLIGARFEGADLSWAHLEGADLSWAHLEGADLRRAHLEGANLRGAYLEGANLSGAQVDKCTLLQDDWPDLPEAEREAARQRLRDRGAYQVDGPDSGGGQS